MKTFKMLLFSVATIFFLTFSHSAVSAHSPDLHEGVSGNDVKELQVKLQKLGYFQVAPTGYYGSITKNAVVQFQRDFGVSATGFTGPQTREKMKQVDMMARTVYGEARGERFEGQVAVAAVIKNRVKSNAFPNSTYGVIFQRNAFTAVNDGQYWLTPNASAYRAVREATKGSDPSAGATYYYNPVTATNQWIFTRTTIKKIGKHVFAK
ncbi:cell wall hydrolase [Planococcus dechangensis]|uniref:Cell wall hydrolase n=1 Tax=Planococcus dechangensis TaxID=1176255 RepID=A0ABV9M703_9BACL